MRKGLLLLMGMILCALQVVYAQTREITGRVTEAQGTAPLAGVTVRAKNATATTQTDADGNFRLQVPENVTSLIFSYVGYDQQEVAITGNTVNASLRQNNANLSEVVVTTGYNSVERRRYSGSTVSVAAEEVRRQPFGSFDQALQGQAPGVSVVANSGQPGAAATVRVRGVGSITGGNFPLYVVDGIQINASDFASLNQGDFERVEILKDAAATSLYGSRGSNGVIVITTRRGRAGQLRLNYDVQYGISNLPKDRLEIMNSQQKVQYELDNGNPYGWTPAEADSLKAVNFDWQDALFRQGTTRQHMLSASGGSENTRVFASLSYLDQDGIVRNTGLQRYTARVNVDNTIGNFKFGVGMQGGYSKINNTPEQNTFISSPLNAARWSNPYERDINPNTGDFQQLGGRGRLISGQPNGAMELFLNRRFFPQLKGIGNAYLEYAVPYVRGLTLRTNWGIDYTQNEEETFINRLTVTGQNSQGANGRLTRSLGRNFRYQGTSSINYKRAFGDHDIDASVFHEVIKGDFNNFFYNGFGLNNFFTNPNGITAGTGTNGFIPSVGGGQSQNGILSYFANINYGFKNKYFVTLTGRRDGSSRFGRDNQFANFGSIGVVWNVTSEDFLSSAKAINDLRLRASYGSTGNQNTPGTTRDLENYGQLPLLGRSVYNGVNNLVLTAPGNPRLRWETNTTANLGLDYALFSNRLTGSLDLYNRLTTDLFVSPPAPIATGAPGGEIPSNFGSIRNRGVEFLVRGDVIRTKDFRFSLDANVTYNQNRIVDLLQDSVLQGTTMLIEGRPINSLYLVRYAGVNPQTGVPQYLDREGKITETYDPANRVLLGTQDAPWFGGFGTNVAYKGLELMVQFNYFLGREVYNNDLLNLMEPSYFFDNLSTLRLQEWRTPGQQTSVPSFNESILETVQNSSFFAENGSFLRLRNVMLSYNLNKTTLDRIKLKSARIFVQGQNLWTATKFRGFDPEVVGNLIGAQYPAMVQGTIGLSVGF